MSQDTTVEILGIIGLFVVFWDILFGILIWKQKGEWARYHTMLTLTRSTRGKFNLADFKHNLTNGGEIALSDEEAFRLASNTAVDQGPWDSEDELSDDIVSNEEIRNRISKEHNEKLRRRLQRKDVQKAVAEKGAIEAALEKIGQGHLLTSEQ